MVIAHAVSSHPPITWFDVVLALLFPIFGALAEYRWRTGWGSDGSGLMDRPAWGSFVGRLGYALRPLNLATLAMTASAAGVLLVDATDNAAIGIVAIVLAAVGIALVVWGVKEFIVPSRWRRHPRWIVKSQRN